MTSPLRLHLGCGRDIKAGWINLDGRSGPGVDVVADLDDCANKPLPLADDSIDEFLGVHVLEHLHHPLPFMQELHRIAKPGAKAVFEVPYGSSDDAFEDPTHVRPYFINSFYPFGQPYYFRADYGYRGDWDVLAIGLLVKREALQGRSEAEFQWALQHLRNVVTTMQAELQAIKPIRPQELATRRDIPLRVAIT